MTNIARHNPAYFGLVAKIFKIKKGDLFLDLTLGDGGHTQEALEAGARVVSLDLDLESIERSRGFIPNKYHKRWTVINSNMVNVGKILEEQNRGPFDSILADLGPSQYQVLSPARGFSFMSSSELDMRLDRNLGVTAKDLLAALGQKELEKIFKLADEPKARQIATCIVSQRKISPIVTGQELANLVSKIKGFYKKTHPATQVFLGLRMAVNLEREVIMETIPQLPGLLKKGGTLGIITFHSTEDRLVKKLCKDQENLSVIFKKPLKPTAEEIKKNPRVRSALLRLYKKNEY